MKTTKDFKRFLSELTLGIFLVSTLNPVPALVNAGNSDELIYPLKEISKLDCRFNDFDNLNSNCKQNLPVLKTNKYKEYSTKNGGYNEYTRLYTVLWGASYKYGWDVGNGGHIGTDIATAKGTPVYSIANGKVINSKFDSILGNYISIEHTIKGKQIVSNYLHLSKLNVKVGDRVEVGKKIGEVGSTGNSTGNHLHFQIDLPNKFHPYYYDYNKCPFSYYQISENGVCINELSKNTIDPLLFLETSGAILNNIKTTIISSNTSSNTTGVDLSIFDKTVYIGYSKTDIKEVQKIYKDLGLYKGNISGNYKDIEEVIIKFQLSNNLIKNRDEYGAGRFGPKTRFTAKKEYLEYLNNGNTNKTKVVVNDTQIKNQKISRKNLLSREEIEKREVEDFLKNNTIKLDFVKKGGNIKVNTSEILKLSVTRKNGKPFKGEMPGGMTFVVNTNKVTVFPEKLFYFTDGKRDIILSGISEGNTKLYIKIGNQTIKTIPLKVFNASKTIYPENSKIISPSKTTLGEKQTGIGLFIDSDGNNLINLEYGSEYTIKASDNNKICIKEGNINNIRKIYKSSCNEENYKNEIKFTYKNTVGGLLIFDYKAISKNFNIEITNNYNNKILSSKKIIVSNPKDLNNAYVYKNEVMDMLEKGIVDGVKKGYFLENRPLTQRDAFTWIENTLKEISKESYDESSKKEINNKLNNIKIAKTYSSKTKTITRKDFLDLSYEYLTLENNINGNIKYRDIDEKTSMKLAKVFDDNTTWKDQFGKNYFRPDEKITRGEGTYFLSKALERTVQTYLTLK